MSLKNMAVVMLAAALTLAGVKMAANENTAYKMASPPVIDGKVDDPGWKGIPWAYGFRNLYERNSFATKQTAFKIGYDQDHLYLAIRCCEPEMSKVKIGARVQDGWPTTVDDVYFIYANSYNEQGAWDDSPFTILQLGAGGIHRALDPKGALESPLEWRTAYHSDGRNWWLETAVPIKLLGLETDKGGFFNVARHLQTVQGSWTQRTSSWSDVSSSKLGQHTLCPLRFSPDNGVSDVAAAETKIANGASDRNWWVSSYTGLLWIKLGKIKDQVGEYAVAKGRFSSSPNWPLAEKSRQEIEAVCQQFPNLSAPGAKTDAYLDWLCALTQMVETSDPIRMELQTRDATIQVFLNGQELMPESGVLKLLLGGGDTYKLLLADGANTLAVNAKGAGPNPGLKIRLPDFPETDGRWAADTNTVDGWQTVDFDDGKWSRPVLDGPWMWSAPGSKNACFRQLLLWSSNVYSGKLACVVPPHTDYGISPGTTEVLQHAIFAPTRQPMTSYILQLEIPDGFRLLDAKELKAPATVNKVDIDGKPYLQYTLSYDVSKLQEANIVLLPVKHENHRGPDGKTFFRFRRLVNDNVTELTSVLDIKILPPVNGRRMESIIYPQYDHGLGRPSVSDELAAELIKQGTAAGMDLWLCSPKNFPDPADAAWEARGAKVRQCVADNGGKVVAWLPGNMPLWGAFPPGELYKLIKRRPEYAVTYFDNSGPFYQDNGKNYCVPFCPTYALGEGRQDFAAALRQDFQRWKDSLPQDARYAYFNNECYPWEANMGSGEKPGEHCYCFCDRCKTAFKQSAGLPADTRLTDQEIFAKHRDAWAKFWRHNQSGRLMELVKEAANSVGFKIIYYHNTHDKDAWRAVSGKSDIYFVGFPGCMAFVSRDTQLSLDDTMRFFDSTGIPCLVGQRSTYFPFRQGKDGRFRQVGSKDAWALNPQTIKTEIVRMAATTHGGVLFEGVIQLTGGSLFHFGEATRLVAAYESLFHDGKRDDTLADAGDYKYPDILVLTKGDERLVLVFNESTEAKTLKLRNHKLKPGQQAEIFEKPGRIAAPSSMDITVPPEDVVAVHVK